MASKSNTRAIRRIDTGYRHLPSSQGCMFTLWVEAWSNKGQALTSKWTHFYHGNGPLIGPSLKPYSVFLSFILQLLSVGNCSPHKTLHFPHFQRHHIVSTLVSEVLALLHFKHHLWSCTHTETHTRAHNYTEIMERPLHNNRSQFTLTYTHAHTKCQSAMVVGSGLAIISL